MESFTEFVNAGAFLNTSWVGLASVPRGQGDTPGFTSPTLDLPTRIATGRVRAIYYTKNPISIVLETGTVWKVSKEQWDYLVATGKEPRLGKMAQIEMTLDGTIRSVNFS